MASPLITLLVVAVICLLLGGIAGMLLGSTSGQSEEESESPADASPPGGRKGGYTVVTRLWREKNSGALVVETEGKAYLAPDPLGTDQRERLALVARDFVQWIGNPASGPAAAGAQPVQPAPVSPPPVQAAAIQPAAAVQAAAGPAVPQTPPLRSSTQGENLPVAQREPAPVTHQPAARTPSPIPPPVKPAAPVKEEPKTMVEQINAVLGEMIAGTRYEAEGLTMAADPLRGVIIWIGPSAYEGIDGVPDPEVQKLIRAAVAEWERRDDALRKTRF